MEAGGDEAPQAEGSSSHAEAGDEGATAPEAGAEAGVDAGGEGGDASTE
jgi:hypothetical protein